MSLRGFALAGACVAGLAAGAAGAEILKLEFSPSPIEHLMQSVEQNRKTVVAPRCAKAPDMSGKLDEAAWAKAGVLTGFAAARVRVCYDADNLYMAIECQGKPPAPAAEPERDAPPL